MTEPNTSAAYDLAKTPYQLYREYLSRWSSSCVPSDVEHTLDHFAAEGGQSVEELLDECWQQARAGNKVPGICLYCGSNEEIYVHPDDYSILCEVCNSESLDSVLFAAGINPQRQQQQDRLP